MAWKVSADPLDFDEAIAWFRKRVKVTRAEWEAMTAAARYRAFVVSNVAQLDMVHDVWAAVDAAVSKGTTLADFKKDVAAKLRRAWGASVDDPAWRLETIFRTNVQSAYATGRYRQATDPDVLEDRPVWMFDAVLDGRETEVCRRCDGTKQPADNEWWRTHSPPLHHNCRSSLITLTEEQAGQVTARPPEDAAQEGFGHAPTYEQEELGAWARAKVADAPAELRAVARERAILGPGGAGDEAVVAKAERHDFEPAGTSISAAFDLGGGKAKKKLQAALDAIDVVHGDGDHEPTPIKQVGGASQHGVFEYVIGGKPVKITVNSGAPYPGVSLLHEIGHFIDNQAIGRRGVNSSADEEGPLADVMAAIRSTQAFSEAEGLRRRKQVFFRRKGGGRETVDLKQAVVEYTLRPQELFARAYARYVAVRAGNADLLAELNREHANWIVLSYRQSWSDADFAAVASALDSLFERLGWMKRKTKS